MDREAFESRVAACRGRLMGIARRYLPPDEDECEDAVQSAILSSWEHLLQFEQENAFEAWLTQILVNQCRQTIRRRKRTSRPSGRFSSSMTRLYTSEDAVKMRLYRARQRLRILLISLLLLLLQPSVRACGI